MIKKGTWYLINWEQNGDSIKYRQITRCGVELNVKMGSDEIIELYDPGSNPVDKDR